MAVEVTDQAWVPWAYDLVEAYARAGRVEEAQALLATVAPAPDDDTHRLQHALVARCRGLLAPRETMLAVFEEALAWHELAGQPFERARTLLCLGERLRRERQRGAARGSLRRSLETFEQLGAAVWAARARAELAATGETLARGPGMAEKLTPQELQVAMVVARGATNAEAAAALFLSPKTIEYHLSNVYRKTQLRSRTELSVLTSAAS
jgi:DNA-binding CsgD family transcriptional regulator